MSSMSLLSIFFLLPLLIEKRYSNLCALCEDPKKCDYPDKFSGYDGAIRCLVENGGDVAFTKVIFVRRFFGVGVVIAFIKRSITSRIFFFNQI